MKLVIGGIAGIVLLVAILIQYRMQRGRGRARAYRLDRPWSRGEKRIGFDRSWSIRQDDSFGSIRRFKLNL